MDYGSLRVAYSLAERTGPKQFSGAAQSKDGGLPVAALMISSTWPRGSSRDTGFVVREPLRLLENSCVCWQRPRQLAKWPWSNSTSSMSLEENGYDDCRRAAPLEKYHWSC